MGRLVTLAIVGISVLMAGIFTVNMYSGSVVQRTALDRGTEISKSAPRLIGGKTRLLFLGEVFWGRRIQQWSEASSLKTAYPFSGLKGFNKQNYDAWIAHLECPSTNTNVSINEQETLLKFNCKPEYLPEAAKWFDVMSLANNHTDNVDGESGLLETREHLKGNGIQYFGHFDSTKKDQLCEIISLPTSVKNDADKTTEGLLPIAFCGHHHVFRLPTDDELAVIGQYAKYFITFSTAQMGAEYKPTADKLKTQTYRNMIDHGADAVIATHPHWVQNSEVYKDKLIMYSLGNFIFDQQAPETARSVSLDTIIDWRSDQAEQWTKLAEDCKAFADNCLAQASELNLKKPDFSLSYKLVFGDGLDHLTKPASDTIKQSLLSRTNWQQTLAELNKN